MCPAHLHFMAAWCLHWGVFCCCLTHSTKAVAQGQIHELLFHKLVSLSASSRLAEGAPSGKGTPRTSNRRRACAKMETGSSYWHDHKMKCPTWDTFESERWYINYAETMYLLCWVCTLGTIVILALYFSLQSIFKTGSQIQRGKMNTSLPLTWQSAFHLCPNSLAGSKWFQKGTFPKCHWNHWAPLTGRIMTWSLVQLSYIPVQCSPTITLQTGGFSLKKCKQPPGVGVKERERAWLTTSILSAQHTITTITQEHPRFVLNEWGIEFYLQQLLFEDPKFFP